VRPCLFCRPRAHPAEAPKRLASHTHVPHQRANRHVAARPPSDRVTHRFLTPPTFSPLPMCTTARPYPLQQTIIEEKSSLVFSFYQSQLELPPTPLLYASDKHRAKEPMAAALVCLPASPSSWCAILEESRCLAHPLRAPYRPPSITAVLPHRRPPHPATDPSLLHLRENPTITTHFLDCFGNFPDPLSSPAFRSATSICHHHGEAPPASPSSCQHPKWLSHLFLVPLDLLHHRILPPATGIGRCRHHPNAMGAPLLCSTMVYQPKWLALASCGPCE
jgi:hypothetical protein